MANISNGGLYQYSDSVRPLKFFQAEDTSTQTRTIKQGQVLKAGTFLEADGTTGYLIAHSGLTNKTSFLFSALTSGQTIIIAGLTFTATGTVSASDVAKAFSSLAVGTGFAAANTQNTVTNGSFTAGTLTGYSTIASKTAATVIFASTTPQTSAVALTNTGTGTATGTLIAVNIPSKRIEGILLNDVNATSANVSTEVYIEASFWASWLIWGTDASVDYITNSDFTTTVCSDYYIGATTNDLKNMFVTGSEFANLGFLNAGETLVLNRGELR